MAIDVARGFRSMLTMISPKLNATVVYAIKKHKLMHWKDPKTFVEKLVKLRIENYNYNPLVKKCSDKYAVREYLSGGGTAIFLMI